MCLYFYGGRERYWDYAAGFWANTTRYRGLIHMICMREQNTSPKTQNTRTNIFSTFIRRLYKENEFLFSTVTQFLKCPSSPKILFILASSWWTRKFLYPNFQAGYSSKLFHSAPKDFLIWINLWYDWIRVRVRCKMITYCPVFTT